MSKLSRESKRDAMIAGGFLSTATLALSFGVTGDLGLALPLAAIAGMGGALIVASPWKSKIANKLRTGPALPIFDKVRKAQPALTFEQATPMITKDETMIRPAQRSQPLRRRQPMSMSMLQEVRQPAKPVNDARLASQLSAEIKQINSTLAALGVNAGTKPQWTQVGGKQLVFYTIKQGAGQRIDAIEKCLPELAEAISGLRRKQTLVRMLRFPLRLEVEHPFHESLTWDVSALSGTPNSALIGKSYDNGPSDFWMPFSDAPHILVAGTTGAGKSVLLNAMVLSLAWNTSPDNLSIYLVDLKNKSLAGLRSLPHVVRFASDVESAAEVVGMAGNALDAKIKNRNVTDARQHLLVIDEYADLSTDTASMDIINHLVRMGREDAVNVIVGTQHPTASVLGKEGTKQNFPMRLVGAVTDASSAQVAAGRAGTGAHLLPRKRGAFLAVQGADIKRINTYMVTHSDVADTVRLIRRKFAAEHRERVVHIAESSPTVDRLESVDDVESLAAQIEKMWCDGASKNAISKAFFGLKFGGRHGDKINDAIALLSSSESSSRVLPRGSSEGSSQCESVKNTISGDSKIIRLRKAV